MSSDTLTATPTVPSGIHHSTEVETDTLSHGSTVVSSFQVGRLGAYGAMATGWATSTDTGQTWQHGLLPGLSAASPSPNSQYVSSANESVLYDAAHGDWLIPTVSVVNCATEVPTTASCAAKPDRRAAGCWSVDAIAWRAVRPTGATGEWSLIGSTKIRACSVSSPPPARRFLRLTEPVEIGKPLDS